MSTPIDLRLCHHAVLLAEDLSFSRASARANLSQTAFSRSIQSLERELGFRVFDRDTRTVSLTWAGRQFITSAKHLLANANQLRSEARDIASSDGGELKIGISLMAVDSVMAGVLPRLQAQRPRLKLKVSVSQWQTLLQQLDDERIELFVAYPGLALQNPRYVVTPLCRVAASVFCRAEHPLLQQGAEVPANALTQFPWALVQMAGQIEAQMRPFFGVPANGALPVSLECDNQALLREAVLSSDTLLLSWSTWLRAELDSGLLVDLAPRLQPSLPASLLGMDCALVHMAGRTLSPPAKRLLALLTEAPAA